MKPIRYTLFAAFLSASLAFAGDTAPSKESINELFKITNVRALLDQTLAQTDVVMQDAMEKALQGQEMNAAQKKAIEKMTKRANEVIKEEFEWDKLEPLYIGIYQEALTQEEVDGMLAFYRTPAGEAVINKMPQVMQKSMAVMRQRMGPILEKLQVIQKETLAEMKELEE